MLCMPPLGLLAWIIPFSDRSDLGVSAKSLQSCPTFSTLWTEACQALLLKGFSRQEYWSGLPCPLPGDLPDPGVETMSLTYTCIHRQVFFTTSANWEARGMMYILQNEVTKVLTHEVNCRAMIYSQPGLFPITLLSLSPRVGPLYRLQ